MKSVRKLLAPNIVGYLCCNPFAVGAQLSGDQKIDLLASLVEESTSKVGLMSYDLESVAARMDTTLTQMEERVQDLEKAVQTQSALLFDLGQKQASLSSVQGLLQETQEKHHRRAQAQNKERQALLDKANTTLGWLASQKVQSGSVQWERHNCVWVSFPQPFVEVPHVVIAPLYGPTFKGGQVWVDQVEKTRFEVCGKGNGDGAYGITWLALPNLNTLPPSLFDSSQKQAPPGASDKKVRITPSEKTFIDTTAFDVMQKRHLEE